MTLLTVAIRLEQDVVVARQRARELAALLGFRTQDQTRMATAVSEIARNAFAYAGGGTVAFLLEGPAGSRALVARITDRGPGIADLDAVLEGRYTSRTGMGMGLVGTRRIMNVFRIETAPSKGTTVYVGRTLPPDAADPSPAQIARITERLGLGGLRSSHDEVLQQNQELLVILDELRLRQDELVEAHRALEDGYRGMTALYREMEDRADAFKHARDEKASLLSHMSHEIRTPLSAVHALSDLLLRRTDGPLTPEQEKQAVLIRQAARDATVLVSDLLDLAKMEAGKIVIRPSEFSLSDLFASLRGMLRPLVPTDEVALRFDDPPELPPLRTDEGKLAQILRNLIANALKFTIRGAVRIGAALTADGRAVQFQVSDTGPGILPEDLDRIFEEFVQVGAVHAGHGTGLGLPLSRKLAELLGGEITVTSRVGEGSCFAVTIPMVYRPVGCETDVDEATEMAARADARRSAWRRG
ncbi:MAG: ATP-binding protein [Nitrospiria bacterium]